MTTTPRGAPELASSQALPETTVNEQIRRTEAGAGRFPVADRVTAPPGTCADGANYIIIATATGAFAGKEGQIATAVGTNAASGWYYRTLGMIDEGVVAYVQDEDAEYKWSGSAWATYTGSGVGSTASTTEQLTGTDTAKAATPDSVAALWEQGADVASAGTTSLGEGGYFNITGTTTITDIDFATDKAGRKAWVKFAGALTLTHNASTLILPTGANITTAAGDTACFVSEGSDVVRCVAFQRADGTALASSGGYTDEQAQDAVGAMIDGSLSYDDATPRLKVAQYIFSFFFTAVPSASEVLALHVAGAAFTIPGNFSAALQASIGTNPTSSFALDVQKNGTTIGTITVSTGGVVTATTTSGTAKSIAAGDVIKIVAPGSADATAANMAFTLIGAR